MIQTTLNDCTQPITDGKKEAQRDVIYNMLVQGPCSCRAFMRKGISQYGARILELRKKGEELGYEIIYDRSFKVFRMEWS